MAQLDFLMEFADVPFLIDTARVIRIHQPHEEYEDDKNLPPEKHQPLTDLVDELNRLLPFQYLQDFHLPPSYPGRNLGALASQWQQATQPSTQLKINDWYYPPSASRWSVFRGLATSAMVKAMLLETSGTTPKTFKMKCVPVKPGTVADSSYTLSTSMYMLPPRPLAEHGGTFDGLFLVTLVDERYYWQYNPVTLRITKDSTWVSLIAQIATALGVTITPPTVLAIYGTPEPDSQLWTNNENSAFLLDAIAYNIGKCVVRSMNGAYTLKTPAESRTLVGTNRGDANAVIRAAGGDMFSVTTKLPAGDLSKSRNAIVPANVRVTFPKYVQGDDPVPHFVNARYANQRPSAWYEQSYGETHPITVGIASAGSLVSGLTGVGTNVIHSTAKALYATEAAATGNPVNQTDLSSLATQIATDYYNTQVAAALDEIYPGTFNWTPEGIHDIVWTYSARTRQGATRVLKTEWNQVVIEQQQSAPALTTSYSSTTTNIPKGVGGPSVAQTWRDSVSGTVPAPVLSEIMTATQTHATLPSIVYLPTQNRWRGVIQSGRTTEEKVLFEGTSGGITSGDGIVRVGIAFRGIDGTVAQTHALNDVVQPVWPDVNYGTNLVTCEKMQFVYPAEWSSGGIQGVRIVPQTQTVMVMSASGVRLNAIDHWSGTVRVYDATQNSGSQFPVRENIWVTDRNARILRSGVRYDGQFVGYSTSGTGATVAPIYTVEGECCNEFFPPHWALEHLSTSRYFLANNLGAYTQATPTANTLVAIPIVGLRGAYDLVAVSVKNVALQAGALVRIGIYADSGDPEFPYPDALLLDSGNIDVSANGTSFATAPAVLNVFPNRLYWLALNYNGTAVPLLDFVNSLLGLYYGFSASLQAADVAQFVSAAQAFGAMPTTFPAAGSIGITNPPLMAVRYVDTIP